MIHITFYPNKEAGKCNCKNYMTTDVVEAVTKWRNEYPEAVFIYSQYKEI